MGRPLMVHLPHRFYKGTEQKRCSTCATWKSLNSFYRDSSAWDGLGHQCGECNKKRKRGAPKARSVKADRECLLCHEPLTGTGKLVCEECRPIAARKAARNRGGYICRESSETAFVGGWVSRGEMQIMLEAGYWPPGTVLDKIRNGGTVDHAVRVEGAELQPQRLVSVAQRSGEPWL